MTKFQTLLCIFFFLFLGQFTFAQTTPNSDQNTIKSATCTSCEITGPALARDGLNSTAAVFDVTALPAGVLGSISRDYSFGTALPSTDELTITFSFSDNSLLSSIGSDVANLAIFDRVKIDLMDGTTTIASYGGNGLLSGLAEVNVLDPATSTFDILIKVPATNINTIRITTGALVSLGTGVAPSNLEVYAIGSMLTDRYFALDEFPFALGA